MKLATTLYAVLLIGIMSLDAQIYKGAKNKISFYSYTPIEDISAVATEAIMILNSKTGDVISKVSIKQFKFPNALMQEHFNENYMETDLAGPKDMAGNVTYPNRYAEFKGKINEQIDYTKDGTHNITITGNLTMHGVVQVRSIPGTIIIKGETLIFDSKFNIMLVDHKIEVPSVVGAKIAEKIDVTIHSDLAPAKSK